jgi:hypothetical protein
MPVKHPKPRDLTKTLAKGRHVNVSKVAGKWRLLGAAGGDLFFLAEVADAGSLPTGSVPNELTQADLFSRRIIDDRSYTIVAHGGAVQMDAARGYAQSSAA